MTEPMTDEARGALRFWAVAEALHGLAIAGLAAFALPWKSPGYNLALLALAALQLAAGHGLFRLRRWGYRLALIGGALGLLAGVLIAALLVASWAYLRGTFGDFGRGASIGALLFAGVALQVLVLYAALKLRGLLRASVRAAFGVGPGLGRALLALCALPLLAGAAGHATASLDPLPPLSAEARTQAIAYVRAALRGEPRPPIDALVGLPVGPAPLQVVLWQKGIVRARARAEGDDLAAALTRATDVLTNNRKLQGRRVKGGRIKIDRVVAKSTIPGHFGPLVALSISPGLDGIRRVDGETTRTIMPDDLVKLQVFGAAPIVPGIRELRFGLDAEQVQKRLGGKSGHLERLRVEGLIETDAGAQPTSRGNTPPPATGPAAWHAAAVAGGDFVLRQIRKDGRFHYQYLPFNDRHPNSKEYSLPRHAGTVYALALLFGETGEARFRTGAERAMAWLVSTFPAACGDASRTCVPQGDWADLGSAALTAVGMAEYQRRTGDAQYAEHLRRLLAFIQSLQRPSGDFDHRFNVRSGAVDRKTRSMFYSEEAALALVMGHEALGDPALLDAAARALDYLTGPKYEGAFLGRFIYGADHWTCIAADEAHPRLARRQWLDFCLGYADFMGRLQYRPGDTVNEDFIGHYGFGTFMVPQAPAAAGFTEAIVSTRNLARKHGEDAATIAALDAQIGYALDALSRDQIRPENAWLMPDPAAATGGIRRSLVEQEVRIDFTQHAVCALTRGAASAQPSGG